MPTAIVTGATGILGKEIVAALAKDPQWTKIHALSRSQKDKYPPSVQHNHLDLMSNANEMAAELKTQGVTGDYVFFAAYMAKADEGEASDVNGMFHFWLSNMRLLWARLAKHGEREDWTWLGKC